MPSSPTRTLPSRRALMPVLTHLLVPMLLAITMAFCYVGAFHRPEPHGLRIDVVTATPAGEAAAQGLGNALGASASVHTVPSAAQARALLAEQKLDGAYLETPHGATVLVATAASPATATVVHQIFATVALERHLPLAVSDVAPVAPVDPAGQGLFFMLVALTVGAYATGIAVAAAGAALSVPVRAGLGLAAALLETLLVIVISGPVLGAIPSHTVPIGLLAWLYVSGVVLTGVWLHTFLKRFTTWAMVLLFVGLNFTTCGGVYAPSLQPGLFAALNSFWNGAGFLQAATRLVYFPGLSIGDDVLRLALWLAAAGVGLVLAAHAEHPFHQRPRRRSRRQAQLELELEEAAVAA